MSGAIAAQQRSSNASKYLTHTNDVGIDRVSSGIGVESIHSGLGMYAMLDSTSEIVIPGLIALALTVAVAAWVTWQLLSIGRRGRPFTVLKAAGALSLFRIGALLVLRLF